MNGGTVSETERKGRDRQTDIAEGQAESISLHPYREIGMSMRSWGHNPPPTPDSQKRQPTPPLHIQLVISAVRQLTHSPWRDTALRSWNTFPAHSVVRADTVN